MLLILKPTRGIEIFFSYAHKDEVLRDKLEAQLSMLQRQGLITSWHDRKVEAGEDLAGKTNEHLNTARIILLLVSPEYVASEQYNTEVTRAMERHVTHEATVIPIILRPTAGWRDAPFGKLQALPKNGRPITDWPNHDHAFLDIAEGIREVIEKLTVQSNTARIFHSTPHSIIELPPPTHPKTILQREKVVKEIYTRLTQSNIAAIVLTGIGGVGKSTLAALVYRYAEEQRRAGNGPFADEALWLKINPTVTMADLTGTLFETLGKPLPDFSTLPPQNLAVMLFKALNTTNNPRLVILDQFEDLLDLQTGHVLTDYPDVGEWLYALNSQPCTCRVLLTSRLWPQGTRLYLPAYMQEFQVEGLRNAEGIELLRKRDVRASEAELRTAVERCQGHAMALTLLASLLHKRNLSMTAFFNDQTNTEHWTENIAHNLLDYIYIQQLDELQRKLLLAFSIYRESMPLNAARALMRNNMRLTNAQIQSALDTLLTQHLLQADEGRYQPHAIVASYTWNHFVEGDEQANYEALRRAHIMAAEYYQHQAANRYLPREQRRHISDVHDLIETIWHRCQAEQWKEAYAMILEEGIFSDLQRWGGSSILLDLYKLLLPLEKWQLEQTQMARIHNELGEIYNMLGQKKQAQKYFEQALNTFREIGDRRGEASTLNNLGSVFSTLSKKEQAIMYQQYALSIYEEIKDRRGKGTTLNNLGKIYDDLGQKEEALKYFEQALSIFREIGDRGGEGIALNNLGTLWRSDEQEKAQEYYKLALSIFREIGDRWTEGTTLRHLGKLYREQGLIDVGRECFQLAKIIFDELQSPSHGEISRWVNTLSKKVREQHDQQLKELQFKELQFKELQLRNTFQIEIPQIKELQFKELQLRITLQIEIPQVKEQTIRDDV